MTEHAPSTVKMEPKSLMYVPPEHVIQFSPDFSMLSHFKLKRRRKRKRDDSLVWFGDVGTTSFRKRPKHKKKKKKVGVIITVSFHYPWPLSFSCYSHMLSAIDYSFHLIFKICQILWLRSFKPNCFRI